LRADRQNRLKRLTACASNDHCVESPSSVQPRSPAALAALSEVICAGDCNYDHVTATNELVTGVAIALGRTSIDACR